MKRPPKTIAAPLPERIARARREGRTQQALDLMRQLVKQKPTPEHQELLRQVVLERGIQLQQQGHIRDAATVFANGLTLGGSAEYRAQLAEHLAACGDAGQALQALGPDADPKLRQRVLNQVADAAVRHGAAGKNLLPVELHAGFEAMLQAFAQCEAGRDDEARAALQTIGLTSPFLDWKLLLRGLLAYYARDDARAVENWQRLDPGRVPARLAAPLRLGIDAAFRAAQPAATQNALVQQAAHFGGAGAATKLQALRPALANGKSLGNAFRLAEGAVAELRRDRPALVQRLAHCFFWAIVRHGQPEDVDRYRRVFGPLANAVESNRLEALAVEERDMWPEAHAAWQQVIRALEHAPDWSGEARQRAQALIWEHLGHNAAEQADDAPQDVPFFFPFMAKPQPLKPDAVTCFEKAIKLAPDRLDGYLALFHLHREEGRPAQARKVGEQLLKRFPEHAETSEALGDLALETQEPAQARDYFLKALAAQPLAHRLRAKLARARQNLGLELALAGDVDAARAEYAAALALNERPSAPVLAQWAVLELKAGQPAQAAELIARAEQAPGQRLAVRYALVSESIRAKLKPAERKRIAGELTAALAQPPTPAEVLALLEAAAGQRQRQLDAYRGQKTHEKTFLRFLDQLPLELFSEAELEKLSGYLRALAARRPWQQCLDLAEQRFPTNPAFPIARLDYYLSSSGTPINHLWALRDTLERARRLVQDLPREAQERFLPQLRQRQQAVEALGGGGPDPMALLENLFDSFGGPDEFDDE